MGSFWQKDTLVTQIQGVPLICWQLRTKFWKLKNHICQKVSPVLKSLGKKLLDGTLKPGKIKLEVFLNWISIKRVKFQKTNSSLPPPPTTFHHHPLAIFLLFWNLTPFFDFKFKNTSNLIFPKFQGAIWKIFIQEFQNRAYFLAYVIFQFSKFSPKLSTYRWDTLYVSYFYAQNILGN